MYKINFNHLYYFLTISKEGSIVKASKKLHITQPALSHQLRILEEDLGKKLFDRVGKRLVINKNGESVKEYASKIFRHSEEMIQFLKSDSAALIKIVKIGTVPWISKDQTYNFIKPLVFSQHIKVQVYQKDLDSLLKDVQNDRLDIILCDSPYSGRSKKLQGHRLEIDPIVCVTATKKNLKNSFPQCLTGKKIINYSESSIMADKIDEFLKTNKLSVQTVGEFTDSSLMRVTIENGGVIGFLPLSVAKQGLKSKSLVKLGELERLKFSLWAITRKNYKKDSLIDNLLQKYKKTS
jgi:LysR family transcriptional activator of nhaA